MACVLRRWPLVTLPSQDESRGVSSPKGCGRGVPSTLCPHTFLSLPAGEAANTTEKSCSPSSPRHPFSSKAPGPNND